MLSWRKSSGDPPETPHGGSMDFLAKSLANPDKIFLKILSGFASDFSQSIWRPPGDPPETPPVEGLRGSPDNFLRDNIAGPHGTC